MIKWSCVYQPRPEWAAGLRSESCPPHFPGSQKMRRWRGRTSHHQQQHFLGPNTRKIPIKITPFSHFLGSPCSASPHMTAFLQHQLWMLQLGLANPTGHSSFYTSTNSRHDFGEERLQCSPGWSQDLGIMASFPCKSYRWVPKKVLKGADFVLEREQKPACNIPACLFLLIPDARPGRIWLFSLSCYHSTICQQILVQT